jgi:hypothetical protein
MHLAEVPAVSSEVLLELRSLLDPSIHQVLHLP